MKAVLKELIPANGPARLTLMVLVMMSTLGFVWYNSVTGLPADRGKTELIFSHKLHVEDQELQCSDCHGGAAESEAGLDNLLPEMAVCSDCHDVDDDNECATCHSNPDDPQEVPRIETYSRMFSHKRHIDADVACESCHAGMAQVELASAEVLPGMVQCLDCHDQHAVTSVECNLCHTPSEPLVPLSHGPDFIRAHSDIARTNAPVNGDKTCQTCHDVNFCQDCHEGDNLDRFSHPLNYAFTHALDAQAFERNCQSCHSDRQFCADCHRDNMVLPRTHVPGFVNRVNGGTHAFEAENDIETCMSCHESNAEEICQQCHGRP